MGPGERRRSDSEMRLTFRGVVRLVHFFVGSGAMSSLFVLFGVISWMSFLEPSRTVHEITLKNTKRLGTLDSRLQTFRNLRRHARVVLKQGDVRAKSCTAGFFSHSTQQKRREISALNVSSFSSG